LVHDQFEREYATAIYGDNHTNDETEINFEEEGNEASDYVPIKVLRVRFAEMIKKS
jgi:hypothetical protein